MNRGIGTAQFASELPDVVVAVAGVVTQLGDLWFVLLGVALLLASARLGWPLTNDPWRDCLFLFAVAIGSYSLTVTLKHAFALPRPPGAATATLPTWLPPVAGSAYESMVTGDGFGFPSGHALKTTAVYGAGALSLTVLERKRRLAAAAVITAVVALSRVVLGVHYVVDVVVGVAVGVAFLALVVNVTDRHPGHALGIATVLGVVAFGTSLSYKSALATVVAVLGLALWLIGQRSSSATTKRADVRVSPDSGDDSV